MNALTAARQAAEAAYDADPTHTNLKALQAAGKAEMDAVVTAFDARNTAPEPSVETGPGAFARTPRVEIEIVAETPRKALHNTIPVAPLVYRTRLHRRHAEDMYEAQVRMDQRPAIVVTPEMEAAYSKYIDEGMSATDGYYAPISRDAFFRLYF